MAKLTLEQQHFIIDELAMWSSPTDTAKAFAERFGFVIDRTQVAKYIPDYANSKLGPKLRARFDARREKFLEEVDSVPIANRVYRIKQLQVMFEQAVGVQNRQQAMQILEQAAKETGGSFTNEHKVKHSGKVKTAPPLNPEQMRMALVDAVAAALEKGA